VSQCIIPGTQSLTVTNAAAYPNADILTLITDFIKQKERQLSVTQVCKHASTLKQ